MESVHTMNKQPTRIRSVARAMQLLFYVSTDGGVGRRVKDIAAAMKMPVPTTYHVLNTLVDQGMLAKNSDHTYHLGPAIGALSEAFHRHVAPPDHLMVPLRELAETTGESAYLSGWRYGEVVVLASVDGHEAVRVADLHLGFQGGAHARASGKVLLAFSPGDVLSRYLERHELEAFTSKTITSASPLRAELDEVRRRGYAIDEEEFREGVACISAPAAPNQNTVFAYTLSIPVDRFRQKQRMIIEKLLVTTSKVSTAGALSHAAPPQENVSR
jgi:IclR family transcriptional regulator, acetate operon repressor